MFACTRAQQNIISMHTDNISILSYHSIPTPWPRSSNLGSGRDILGHVQYHFMCNIINNMSSTNKQKNHFHTHGDIYPILPYHSIPSLSLHSSYLGPGRCRLGHDKDQACSRHVSWKHCGWYGGLWVLCSRHSWHVLLWYWLAVLRYVFQRSPRSVSFS